MLELGTKGGKELIDERGPDVPQLLPVQLRRASTNGPWCFTALAFQQRKALTTPFNKGIGPFPHGMVCATSVASVAVALVVLACTTTFQSRNHPMRGTSRENYCIIQVSRC